MHPLHEQEETMVDETNDSAPNPADGAHADEAAAATPAPGEAISADIKDAAKLSLATIDLKDRTYQFRENLRIGPLADSLRENGLQVPIILRARKQGHRKYQLISGFRRCAAAIKLGWLEIPAVVRRDLDTDEAAFKAAVLENTNRKTYSDIDRAHVLLECRHRKLGDDALPMDLLGLKERQRKHLLSLLKLPKAVQEAIDDPEQHFATTHALTLRQLTGKYAGLQYEPWIKQVNEGKLSVAQLKRAVKEEHGAEGASKASGFTGLFRADGTDEGKGVFRFNPVAVDVEKMSDEEKKALRAELEKVLAAL